MDINEAFRIVLDLAQNNVIDQYDDEMTDERKRQLAAIAAVEDFAIANGINPD